jgi:hypothetical protein
LDLKQIILGSRDLPKEAVPTPEWAEADGELFARTMTARERVALQLSMQGGRIENYWAKLAAAGTCDSEGKRVFEDADADALGELDCRPIERLGKAVERLNGIGAGEEEVRKN